ncbi:MAG: TolC family protein [Prevotellaceae bacterium]|jgi:outer membrane protein TolC|nr:TolC family protein [Prevotellaceae bacterium]
MNKLTLFPAACCLALSTFAQAGVSIDSCRALAIAHNKALLISREQIKAAHYERKAAFTKYLPGLSASGGYLHNQRSVSLLSQEMQGTLRSLGTTTGGALQNNIGQLIAAHPEWMQNPQLLSLLQAFGSMDIATPLNAFGSSITEAFRTNTRNLYAGTLTLTQPLYMGGKIRAYNAITRYAEQLAKEQHHTALKEVILNTDQAYWQVVSVSAKREAADSYVTLLGRLNADVEQLIGQGVATRADGLSVAVKLNEAQMMLTKVEDGLSLSRMLLCQLCGLDLSHPIVLKDEQTLLSPLPPSNTPEIPAIPDLHTVYNLRPEVRSLALLEQIRHKQIRVARAEFLPSVALVGNYMVTNPSVFNGFENRFKGMWNVGVAVQLPLWHWGEGLYKVRAAKAEARIARYRLDDAKEKIALQVSQARFKADEASRKLRMTQQNSAKADENLRIAKLGFEEGVIPTSNLLEAHAAWLSAQSEWIDAQIDVKLTDLYLRQALGE